MTKEIIIKNITKTLLFLLAITIVIWAYYSNLKYNLYQGLDAFSGATQMYN